MLPSNSNSGAANRTMCCTVVTCNNSHLQQPRPQFQPTYMDDSNSILVEYDADFETRNQEEIHNVNKTAAQIALELINPDDSKDAPIAYCDRCWHKMERIVNRPIQAITCGHSVCEGCLDSAVKMEQARLDAGGERNLTHGTEGGHLFMDCHLCQAPRAWHTKHRHVNILACASFLLISKREHYWRKKVVGAWQKRLEELEGQVEDLKRQLAEEKKKNGQLQVEELKRQLAEEKKKNGQLQEEVVGMAEAEQRRAAAQVPPPQKQPEGQGTAAAAAPVRKKPPPAVQQQEHAAKLPARQQKEQQDVAKMPPSAQKQQNKVAANVPTAQMKEPPQQQSVARMPPLPNTTVAKLPPAQQKQAPQQIQQVQKTSQAAHSRQSLPLQQQHQKELSQARAVDQAAVNSEGDYDDMDEESEDEDDDHDDENDPVIAAAAEAAAAAAFATLRKPSSASSVNSAGSGSGTAAVYGAHTAMTKAIGNASKHKSTPAHQEQKHRSTEVLAASTTKPPAHPTNGNGTSVAAAKEIPDQQLQQKSHCQELQEQQQRLTQQVIHDTNHHDHDHDKKPEFIQHPRKPQDEDDEPLVPSQRLLPGGGRYLGNPDTVRQQEEQETFVPHTRDFAVAQRNYYLKNPLREEKEKADGAGGSIKSNAAPTATAGNIAAGKAASDEKKQTLKPETVQQQLPKSNPAPTPTPTTGNVADGKEKKQTKKPETVQQQLAKSNAAPTLTAGNVAAGKAASDEKKQTKKPETVQQQLAKSNAAPTPTAGNVADGKEKKQTKKSETVQQQLAKSNAAPTPTAGNVAAGKAASDEKEQTKKPETVQQQLPNKKNSPKIMRLFVYVRISGGALRPAYILGYDGENTVIQWADTEEKDLIRSDRITTKPWSGTTTVSATPKRAAKSATTVTAKQPIAASAAATEGKTRHKTKKLLEKIERIVGDGLKKAPPPESRKRLRPVATVPTPEEEEACKRANLGVRTHGTSTTVKNNMSMRAVTTALAPKGKSVRTAMQKEVRAPPHQSNANSAPPDPNPKAKRRRRPKDQIMGDVSQDNILPRRSRSPPKKQQPPSAETNNAALPLEKPKRGRPSKKQPLVTGAKAAPPVEKPKRGRPPKQQQPVPAADANNNSAPPVEKPKRGKPPKQQQARPAADASNNSAPPVEKPKRGRQPKQQRQQDPEAVNNIAAPPVEKPKRGRPSKKQQLAVSDDSNAMSVSPKRGQGTQPKGATSLGKAAVRAARHSADSLLNQDLVEDPADPFAFPGQRHLSGQDSNGSSKERVPAESSAKVPPAKVSTAKAPPVGRRGRSRAAKALSPKPPPPAKKTTKAKVPKKRGPGRPRKVSFVDNNDGALGIKDPGNNDGALGIKDTNNNDGALGIKDPANNGRALGIKGSQGDPCDVDNGETLVDEAPEFGGIKSQQDDLASLINRRARGRSARKLPTRRRTPKDEDDELLKIERIGRFEFIHDDDDDSSDDDSSDDDDEIEILDHAQPKKVSADSLAPGNAAANANEPDSLAVSPSPDSQVEGGQANVPAMLLVLEEHSEKPVHTGRYPRLGEHVI